MKNLTPTIIMTAAFCFILFSTDANAQSCNKTEKTACVKSEQSLGAVNAEILALEKELASLELVAKQNNIDLGTSWNYMILNKTAAAAVTDEKATAKK